MSGFQDVTWSDDQDIDAATLNKMTSNERWLYDNMTDGQLNTVGVVKTTGLKIMGGTVIVQPHTSDTIQKDVSFGSFFSPSCYPTVTVSISGNSRCFIHVGGVGDNNQRVDNRGFRAVLVADPKGKTSNYFPNAFYLHYIAMGY